MEHSLNRKLPRKKEKEVASNCRHNCIVLMCDHENTPWSLKRFYWRLLPLSPPGVCWGWTTQSRSRSRSQLGYAARRAASPSGRCSQSEGCACCARPAPGSWAGWCPGRPAPPGWRFCAGSRRGRGGASWSAARDQLRQMSGPGRRRCVPTRHTHTQRSPPSGRAADDAADTDGGLGPRMRLRAAPGKRFVIKSIFYVTRSTSSLSKTSSKYKLEMQTACTERVVAG